MALNRRRKNKIWKIRAFKGIWFDKQEDILRVFANGFFKRFKYEMPGIYPNMFESFNPCILEEKNMELIKEVTEEEILIALCHINSLKDPRPD